MADTDIVAELDQWLDQPAYEEKPRQAMRATAVLVRRARDEIVERRERRADIRRVVLEEAALACEALGVGPYQRSAAAIRALKDRG